MSGQCGQSQKSVRFGTRSLLTLARSLLTLARSLLTLARSLLTLARSLLTLARSLLTLARSHKSVLWYSFYMNLNPCSMYLDPHERALSGQCGHSPKSVFGYITHYL